MLLHCKTPLHPLIHHGTQQRERLLQQLVPANLQLDDRSIAELLAFAGQLAQHIRYWDANNEAAGDWTAFWESDPSSLLAIIAATDLEDIRTNFRNAELVYLRLKKREEKGLDNEGKTAKEALNNLVTNADYGIYGIAKLISHICKKAPANHPLQQDIQSIIASNLPQSLKRLIQFHKAIDRTAISHYQTFIGSNDCAAPWGLANTNDFECLDYVLPEDFPQELWKLFLKFYQTLHLIINKAQKALRASLRIRNDHTPHITLFISFLHLFRYLQADFNQLPERHLIYYYKDVLRLQERREIPDKVHIVFKIAESLERYRIEKGTLLNGGTDLTGTLRKYALLDELVASQAVLVEKKNMYINSAKNCEIIALPQADLKDGVEETYAPTEKAWNAFSGKAIYDDLQYKRDRLRAISGNHGEDETEEGQPIDYEYFEKINDKISKIQFSPSIIVTSPNLYLEKSQARKITIDFSEELTAPFLSNFTFSLSTLTGMQSIGFISNSASSIAERNSYLNFEVNEIDNFSTRGIVDLENNPNQLHIYLDPRFPKVELPEENNLQLKFPYLEIKYRNYNCDQLEELQLNPTNIRSQSRGLFNYQYYYNRAIYQATDEINLQGENTLYVITPELIKKAANEIFIQTQPTEGQEGLNTVEFYINKWLNAEQENSTFTPEGFFSKSTNFDFDTEALEIKHPLPNGIIKVLFSSRSIPPQSLDIGYRQGFNSEMEIFHQTPYGLQPVQRYSYASYLDHLQQPQVANLASEAPTIGDKTAHGNLFLGFEHLVPNQTLSLLFKMAEGTGNPDHFAPEVVWSYLRNEEWIQFPPQYILKDETKGMKQTGIIRFQIPSDINNGNTWITGAEKRTDLFWLRASAHEIPDDLVLVDALPMLVDIHVNAVTAGFLNENNSLEHLVEGLPPTTITALHLRDVRVDEVKQPYLSFGGRLSEEGDRLAYYRRIHERLRHRQRAVTVWDYERLVLEQFPKVAVIKCLSHSRRFAMGMPGHVTLSAIPYPDKMIGNRKFFPTLDAGDLETIKEYINQYNSYFVSGYGAAQFCCCTDEDTTNMDDTTTDDGTPPTDDNTLSKSSCCNHSPNRLKVINARFEPIRLIVCVRFRQGFDIPFYTKELNEALKRFLAPWAMDSNQPLLFGATIHTTQLLQFLENLEYVDVITNLGYKHFATRESADYHEMDIDWVYSETIQPYTAASVLTTYLDRLNEDNPNVIDHQINVITDPDHCACGECEEKTVVKNLPNYNRSAMEVNAVWGSHIVRRTS